jgi:hypothetical protein
MSANLYWEPVSRTKRDLSEGAPSSFMDMLERAFGSRCPKLGMNHVPILRAMAVASERKSFDELADAIERTEGEIQVSAEY